VKLLLSIFLLVGNGTDLAVLDRTRESLRPFLDAVAIVESNGNDAAVGDGGKAIGRYQIWEVYWRDAVAFSPSLKGNYQDVTDKTYAERVMVAYLLRYAKGAVESHDYEKLARIHNGGPKGYQKNATLKYWNRVRENLSPEIQPSRMDRIRQILEGPQVAFIGGYESSLASCSLI
jgi:hypothetical protein